MTFYPSRRVYVLRPVSFMLLSDAGNVVWLDKLTAARAMLGKTYEPGDEELNVDDMDEEENQDEEDDEEEEEEEEEKVEEEAKMDTDESATDAPRRTLPYHIM